MPTAELVGDRYRLGHTLGTGGMGRVWEATDTVLERPVAVKAIELPPHLDHDDRQALRTRVMREARAAARIDHPSSVRVFDVLEDHGRLHVVMELVSAPTLEALVADEGPLSPTRVAAMGLGVLGALEAAHAAGIVHRDVKPANVMMLADGGVKLADFGIASVKDDTRITAAGLVLGTPSYMSPEQAVGRPTGPSADLWSLGALLYFAVEGVGPFDRGEALPTLNAVLHDPPRPMERATGLAPAVVALLTKDPDDRPTAAQSRVALEGVTRAPGSASTTTAAGRGATAVMPAAAAVPPPSSDFPPLAAAPTTRRPPELADPAATPPAPTRRRAPGGNRGWLGGLAAIVLVAAVVLVVGLNRGPEGESASTDAGPGPGPEVSVPQDPAAPENPPATTVPSAGEAGDPGPAEPPPTPAQPDAGRPDGVPGDWTQHSDASGRYTIWHPPAWTPGRGQGASTDFRDPATGDYLRVDFVSAPGDDPVQAWEDASERFSDRFDSYNEIGIEATQYQGFDAAIWEYTYEGRHATNLGVVAADDLGFALNFQTGEQRWGERQDIRRAFEAGFRLAR